MSHQPPLEAPDVHCLSAALGWLGLGNPKEAQAELDQISAAKQKHVDVLEVRWLIRAEQKDWRAALALARAIQEADSGRASGWLHYAYALRRVPEGGVEQAWDALRPAVEKFPGEAIIPYNLSCYACRMNRLSEARQWLARAMAVGGQEKFTRMALADADLKPLWREIA